MAKLLLAQKKSPARKLRTGVVISKTQFTQSSQGVSRLRFLSDFHGVFLCSQQSSCVLSGFATPHGQLESAYFRTGPFSMNAFTTILFGCTPTGIMVSREYSLGSSLRGLRFWITVTSPDCESSTSR